MPIDLASINNALQFSAPRPCPGERLAFAAMATGCGRESPLVRVDPQCGIALTSLLTRFSPQLPSQFAHPSDTSAQPHHLGKQHASRVGGIIHEAGFPVPGAQQHLLRRDRNNSVPRMASRHLMGMPSLPWRMPAMPPARHAVVSVSLPSATAARTIEA